MTPRRTKGSLPSATAASPAGIVTDCCEVFRLGDE